MSVVLVVAAKNIRSVVDCRVDERDSLRPNA